MYSGKLKVLTLSLAFIISGCSLIPDYATPEMPVARNWPGSAHTSASSEAGNVNWESFYQNTDMQHLIRIALENNRDLRVAALNVQVAQARFGVERSALMPTINAGLSKTAEHLPDNLNSTRASGPVTYQQYQANLATTTWEIDFFGRLRSLKESAWENYMSQEQTVKAAKLSLVAEVGTAWLSLAADNDLLSLAIDTYKSQKKSYELIQYGVANGTATEQDLMQAMMSMKSAEADVSKYSRLLDTDKNTLTLLLGAEAPDGVFQRATLNKAISFRKLDAGIPSDILTQRPDIIAAEHVLKSANANIGAARAAFFPSISITASGGTVSDSFSKLFDGGTGAWSFVPTLNIPIFTGGRNKANLDIANLSERIEVANYQKAIQQAFKEVSDSLIGRETYSEELKVRNEDNQASKRYYELASARFENGVDSYLNVLVAQRSYYQSHQTLIITRQNALLQDIKLYKSLGGGWN